MTTLCHTAASLAWFAYYKKRLGQSGNVLTLVIAALLGGVLVPDSAVGVQIIINKMYDHPVDSGFARSISTAYNMTSSFLVWSVLAFWFHFLKNREVKACHRHEYARLAEMFSLSGLIHVVLDSVSHGNLLWMTKSGRHYFWPLSSDLGMYYSAQVSSFTQFYNYIPASYHGLGIFFPGDTVGWVICFSLFSVFGALILKRGAFRGVTGF